MTTAHAPGARRATARDTDIAEEDPVIEGGWRARLPAKAIAAFACARRAWFGALVAASDRGIALLQRLRQRAGGAEPPDQRRARPGKRTKGIGVEDERAAVEAVAPAQRRRLRGLLVYLGMLLAGSMGGMALSYDLLAKLLEQRSAEIKRQEIKLSKYSKSALELKTKLEQLQAKQIEAEARFAAALAENGKKLGELQAKRVEAETRLAGALVRASAAPGDSGSSRDGARGEQAGWVRSGNCTLGSGDVRSVLNGCIVGMSRK